MEGQIAIRFERDPDYFVGARIQNLDERIYIGWDKNNEKAFAICNVGSRPVYVGNQIQSVPYYCDLRILPEYRNKTILARGFRFLRESVLVGDSYAQCLIVSDNDRALDALTSGRGGLPNFYHTGNYNTWAISLGQSFGKPGTDVQIRRARREDLPGMQQLLDIQGPHKLFYPAYELQQIGKHPYYLNQKIEDYFLAFRNGKLVGMLGTWDLEFCKQSRVVSYAPSIRWFRRAFNKLHFLNKGFQLPQEGSLLKYFVLHTVIIKDNDPAILQALIQTVGRESSGYDYFLLGLSATDALNHAVNRMKKRLYKAGHYIISYGRPEILDSPVKDFYLEVARL
jgi:hypothetical protein